MYLHTKFHLATSTGLGCVYYTAMSLVVILDQRWRLCQHFAIFS